MQVTTIMLAVADMDRAKKFYEGIGAKIAQDYPQFVKFGLSAGSDLSSAESGPPGECPGHSCGPGGDRRGHSWLSPDQNMFARDESRDCRSEFPLCTS